MSREDIIAIGTRLFAVFLVLGALRQLIGTVPLLVSPGVDPGLFVAMLLVPVLGLAVGAWLWFFPLTVARKLLPVMREPRSEQAMDARVAFSVGLTLLGVWLLANGLADAVYWWTLFLRARQVGDAFAWSSEQVAGVVATVVELPIAAWLVFGATGIRRLIERYRYGSAASQA
jgi:hypothetical protein